MTEHIHDCTGPDATCSCGYVFRVPPISVAIEVFDQSQPLVTYALNCETVAGAIRTLRAAADRLERTGKL